MSTTLPVTPEFQQESQMQWTQAVSRLADLAMQEDSCCLQMGDHLNVIEKQWGGRNKMKLAAQEAGVTWALARQRSWVAKRIAPGHNLRDTQLSYSHLRQIANTKDPDKWGALTIENNWTVSRLKEEIELAEDKQAQATGETCCFCELAFTEELEIVSFRIGREKARRCCGIGCAAGIFDRMIKEAAGLDELPASLKGIPSVEDDTFNL